jgi:hypothetical protein
MITEVDNKLPQIITSTPKSMEETFDDAATNLPEITLKTNVPIIINKPISRGNYKTITPKSDDKTSLNTSKRIVDFNGPKIENDVIVITIRENGDTIVKSTKYEKIIEDHIGNFSGLSLLSSFKDFDSNFLEIEKINNPKSRNEFIKDFKALIKFCLVSLKGFEPQTYPKDNTIFKVFFGNFFLLKFDKLLFFY